MHYAVTHRLSVCAVTHRLSVSAVTHGLSVSAMHGDRAWSAVPKWHAIALQSLDYIA